MPKARDYQLNEAELQSVETAIRRDKRPEVQQRCTAIRLLHLGQTGASSRNASDQYPDDLRLDQPLA
jgi:hypothetical protein